MLTKSTLLHLRIPFSFFLMPIFCFVWGVSHSEDWGRMVLIFLILHLLIYPASNGYNSYYDKDEESIGGLENPPPVSKELLWTAWVLDLVAILLGFLINSWFSLGILIYGLVSKAYSYDKIRLKKYPILSWLTIGIFQGFFTFLIVYQGLTNLDWAQIMDNKILLGAGLSSWMLLGSYPMTQVYQHQEDAKRGDLTMSRLLGIRGTFLFTLTVFGLAGVGFFVYFWHFYSFLTGILFQIALVPVVGYFLYWFYQVIKDETQANFKATMRLNLISAICLNTFFIALYFMQ